MDVPATDTTQALSIDSAAELFASAIAPKEPQKAAAEATPKADAPAAEPPKTEAPAEVEAAKPEETSEEAEPTVTVKIDGKDVEVPLSELKKGYQTEKSSTERFMAAAEIKRAAEAETAKARAERESYATNLQRMQARLEGEQLASKDTNWDELIRTDPVEYLRQQHLANKRQETLNQVYAEQQRIAALNQAEAQKAQSAYLAAQQEELLSKLPEWKDEAKSKAEKAQLREYLLNAGYAESDVASVSDARAVILARKAMMYDKIIANASAAAKKVSTLPSKVERPGAGEAPVIDKRSAAFQKLSKSGRIEDAAAVFSSLLN
jgi:hypothetical protein